MTLVEQCLFVLWVLCTAVLAEMLGAYIHATSRKQTQHDSTSQQRIQLATKLQPCC
eukprot:m.142482 g.142482  ORF g.142482 m.142482 type:complete len:56 (+) comp14057_c1_seq6:102-269(+)